MGKSRQSIDPSNAAPATTSGRVDLVDILRGLALTFLVLEAARQYFHGALYRFDPLDLTQTTPAIFATRWVTHLCAPVLALLAGVSAFLRGDAGVGRAQLSRYLFLRGLLLIAIELTILTFGRNFTLPPPILLQALATVGAAMVALAVLVWLPRNLVLVLGVAALAGTDLLDSLHPWHFGPLGWVWQLLHEPLAVIRDDQLIAVADYSLIPWVAIAMIGYGLGPVFNADPARRDRILFLIGVSAIAVFLVLRLANLYGDPNPWSPQHDPVFSVMSFLNVTKFPPSLLFACATLGPVLLLSPLLARLAGPVSELFRSFGREPLFTYIAHFYLVHAMALLTLLALGRDPSVTFDAIGKFVVNPRAHAGEGFDLPVVYLVWVAALAILYPLSRWWADLKRRDRPFFFRGFGVQRPSPRNIARSTGE